MAKFKVTIETPTTRHKHILPKKKSIHRVKHRFDSNKQGEVWLPMANYFNEAKERLEGKEGKEKEMKFWGEDWAGVNDEDEEAETKIFSGEVPKRFEIKSERQATTLERPFANIPEDEETKEIPTYSQEYGLEDKKGKETDKGIDIIGFVGRKLEEQSEKARKEVYGNMLKDIAEKGAFYKPSSWAGNITYNNLKKQGFADEDEFGRPFVTGKGKDLLKEWKIPYKEKSREPKFEEKKDEEVEKIVTEAEKGRFEVAPKKPEEMTAQELVGSV